MDDWDKLKAELLEDPATRKAYEERRPAYELASKLMELRSRLKLSQKQLAAKAGMTQPEIARLESATVQPTWETVSRILAAVGAAVDITVHDSLGKKVKLSIVPSEQAPRTKRKSPSGSGVSARRPAAKQRASI